MMSARISSARAFQVMKTTRFSLLFSLLISVACPLLRAQNINAIIVPTGTPPSAIRNVSLSGTATHPSGAGRLVFTNARITASGWSPMDYGVLLYEVSNSTGALSLLKADRYPGIGCFFEDEVLLGTNVTSAGTLTLGTTSLAWGRSVLLTSPSTFTATVSAGSSITVKMASASVAYSLIVREKATGREIYRTNGPAVGVAFHWPVALLRTAAYTIQITPVSGTTFRGTAVISHNNLSQSAALGHGGVLSYSLPADSFSYAKARVQLRAGQNLRVTLGRGSAVDVRIITPDNNLLSAAGNLSSGRAMTSIDAPVSGEYTVFIRKTESVAAISAIALGSAEFSILP